MQRNNTIDFLKGIAMYLVVANHLANQIMGTNIYTQIISLIHLPLLFTISGFLFNISRKKWPLEKIIFEKTKHLLLPYISWSMIALVFSCVLNCTVSKEFLKNEFIEIFIYGRSVWFLLILYLITLSTGIFLHIYKGKVYIVRLLCFFVFYGIIYYFVPDKIFQLNKFKVYLIYFILGMLLNEYKQQGRGVIIIIKKMFLILIMSFMLGTYYLIQSEQANYMVDFKIFNNYHYMIALAYLLTIVGMSILFCISQIGLSVKIKEFFGKIGTYSLDIYVLHMFFIKVVGKLFPKNIKMEIGKGIVIFIFAFVISNIIVILKEWLLKRISIYNLINGEW